ncbi:hypothetical protein GJ496_005624 [Pomphorhynchus laevis]|nr:hypothetical protein GJ496_005624 [Pomphorhynchus laevis]
MVIGGNIYWGSQIGRGKPVGMVPCQRFRSPDKDSRTRGDRIRIINYRGRIHDGDSTSAAMGANVVHRESAFAHLQPLHLTLGPSQAHQDKLCIG